MELYTISIVSFSVANFRRASHIVSNIVDLHPEDGQEDIKEALQIAANAHGLPSGSLGTIHILRKHILYPPPPLSQCVKVAVTKGHLISEQICEDIDFPKSHRKYC